MGYALDVLKFDLIESEDLLKKMRHDFQRCQEIQTEIDDLKKAIEILKNIPHICVAGKIQPESSAGFKCVICGNYFNR